MLSILHQHDTHGYVKKFIDDIENSHGTLIIMDNLSIKRSIPPSTLMESIGQRFTVTLLRDDFTVYINDKKLLKMKHYHIL